MEILECKYLKIVLSFLLQMYISPKYQLLVSLITNNQYRPWKKHISWSLFMILDCCTTCFFLLQNPLLVNLYFIAK